MCESERKKVLWLQTYLPRSLASVSHLVWFASSAYKHGQLIHKTLRVTQSDPPKTIEIMLNRQKKQHALDAFLVFPLVLAFPTVHTGGFFFFFC